MLIKPDLTSLGLWIPGKAAPGGSKKGFIHPYTKRVIIADDAKGNADWKKTVATHARFQYRAKPLTCALEVNCIIYIQRPKHHFGTGKNSTVLKESAPKYPTVKPDATKLWRSTEDALTGIIWSDDAIICDQIVLKRYCNEVNNEPGVMIMFRELKENG